MRSPYYKDLLEEFAECARDAGKHGLLSCSSGNLSHRNKEGVIMVSASRAWLAKLTTNDIQLLVPETNSFEDYDLSNCRLLSSEKTTYKLLNQVIPTGELPLHLRILENFPQYNTVLHCQSPAATTLACRKTPVDNYNVIIEVPLYIGKVKHLPYIMPGSDELAHAIVVNIQDHTVIQLQNHGQIIAGKSFADVIQKAVFFELASRIILANEHNAVLLDDTAIAQLSGYR